MSKGVLGRGVGNDKGDRSPVKKEDKDGHDQPNSLSVIGFGPEVENQHFAKNTSCDVGDSHVFEKMPRDGETGHRKPDSEKNVQHRNDMAAEREDRPVSQLEDVGADKDRKN